VRGELDWIVMKTLEKDRVRRYETVTGLAHDVERYLNDEPVLACPPSAVYRLRKFVRRNKVGVLAGSAIAAALVLGMVGTRPASPATSNQRGIRSTRPKAFQSLRCAILRHNPWHMLEKSFPPVSPPARCAIDQ
jgi:hypothetical protein